MPLLKDVLWFQILKHRLGKVRIIEMKYIYVSCLLLLPFVEWKCHEGRDFLLLSTFIVPVIPVA